MAQMLKASTARLTWGAEAPKVTLEDDGDILNPLRKVYNEYVAKAAVLFGRAAGGGDEEEIVKKARIRRVAEHYAKQAENIQQLLNQ